MQSKQSVLENWVELYSNDLYNWAFYKLKNKEQAEDLVQDCFISAFANYEKFLNKAQPKTWLFTILNNKIYDFFKKDKKEKALFIDENSVSESNFQKVENNMIWEDKNLLDNPEFNKVFNDCLNKLPEKYKDVIAAKIFFRKKSEEICQVFELSSSNLWQIVRRSKLLLKDCLELNWLK